jgi:hypothetical protein
MTQLSCWAVPGIKIPIDIKGDALGGETPVGNSITHDSAVGR